MTYDYTMTTARTAAQRRDAIEIANRCGPVRRALNFSGCGFGPLCANVGNDVRLAEAIRITLAIAKVRRVNIQVVDASGIGRAVFISPENCDQYSKVAAVMRAIGFETSNAHHYTLTKEMQQEGFSL